jgi:hypothetical protein
VDGEDWGLFEWRGGVLSGYGYVDAADLCVVCQ